MKSQFIQDVEAFAYQMAVRLPITHEGGIIIMAADNEDVAKCIIATPSCRKILVEHILADGDIQNDVIKIIEESSNEQP